MNKAKIDELYEQAHDGKVFNRYRFAKLIVQECMTMSSELKAEYLKDRKQETDFSVKNIYAEGEAACDTLKYRMKKRFGVEE
jgi:vacuolar-type H+-ATPase subunit H